MSICEKIAKELQIRIEQVNATIELLDNGATVPFISRYRKEVTGSLTDTQLRQLEERLHYLRELDERRKTIIKSITEQGKLTDALNKQLLSAEDKTTLEDLYAPYKPKRRTKSQLAKEAGLEPLAITLLEHPEHDPISLASHYIKPDSPITTSEDALEGARHILMELMAEHAELIQHFRAYLWKHSTLISKVAKGKETEGSKFLDYFEYKETIHTIPSHRALALFRGQRESILQLQLTLDESHELICQNTLSQAMNIENQQRPADAWLQETVQWAWKYKIFIKLELELLSTLREEAETEAIHVFAKNLRHLLMAAPAGTRVTLGLDPGLRTGVKAVVVDKTGKLVAHTTVFPHAPRHDWDGALLTLATLCQKHHVELISIGNGTASRETDKLVHELKKKYPSLTVNSIVVSEAGASVYSASELAAKEFPELDVTYRGAVSIARRLQDPLAELVKIDPKSIGVGQYQHDVNQFKLSRSLQAVMEDCVNAVGVDVNTASAPLLSCVAGLNDAIANHIIAYRDTHGAFTNRTQLKKIPRLGERTFEQAAGFLRIMNGDNRLDASAVHPEAYTLVETILQTEKLPLGEVMGNPALLKKINPTKYVNDQFGLPTVKDILTELEKPGRDPRPEFKTAHFQDDVHSLEDLKVGMILEGVVTNVANFGAFVDIGVHQDGLVHVSMLANRFVKNPNDVVAVGNIVKVKVISVDIARKRIQLSMKLDEAPAPSNQSKPSSTRTKSTPPQWDTTLGGSLLAALKK